MVRYNQKRGCFKKKSVFLITVCMFLGGCKGLAQTKEISFRVQDGHIQWKYGGDTTWTNIISADELKEKVKMAFPAKTGLTKRMA